MKEDSEDQRETTIETEKEDSPKVIDKSPTLEVEMLASTALTITDLLKDLSKDVKPLDSKDVMDPSVVMVLVTIVDPETPTTDLTVVNAITPKVVLEDTTGELKVLKLPMLNLPKEDLPPSLNPKS